MKEGVAVEVFLPLGLRGSRRTGALNRGRGSPKPWKQEPADWKQKKDSSPAMKDSCIIHLPLCPEPSIMSTQDWDSAGWNSVCPGMGGGSGWEMTMGVTGQGSRGARDPGEVLAQMTSLPWPSVTWSGRPPVETVVPTWWPPMFTLKLTEGGGYNYACVHHCLRDPLPWPMKASHWTW